MNIDKQYFSVLDNIELTMNQENADEIEKILDKVYNVKPVRLKWFILKAKITKLLGKDLTEIREILFKKYNLLYNSQKLEEIAYCLIDLTEDEIEKQRFLYHIELKNNIKGNDSIVFEKQNEYNELIDKYIHDIISQKEFEMLILNCYIRSDFTQYILFNVVYKKIYNTSLDIVNWVLEMPNVEMNIERLSDCNNKSYIVVEDEQDTFNCMAIIKALEFLGNNVFYLDKALVVDVPNKTNIKDTIPISLGNAEQRNDCIIIHPVKLRYDGNVVDDNLEYLVDYIDNNLAGNKLTMIYSSGFSAGKLCNADLLKKNTERMSIFKADYLEGNLNVSRSGDYLSYISEIYKNDVHESVNRKAECDFSIVIPVANNIDTFKYTLQTCVNIRYEGSYEIVVSDNSTNGSTIVYDYITGLNDKHIKYYKTPRALPLTKSFEFAFLKARGEFIFSVGADDGVLPWSLDVLKDVLEQVPEQEVFLWDRGFYAWPGFNGGQQNQFIIPKGYIKGKVEVNICPGADLLMDVIHNPQKMYGLPLLYINSGFRRSYFKSLIEKSGRMWDGHSQDIYMGVLNTCINPEIVTIEYPITIAGMSGNSIGRESNYKVGVLTDKHINYMNFITMSPNENLIPCLGTDIQNLYCAILRMVSRGILSVDLMDSIMNRIEVYHQQIFLLNKRFDLYDEYIDWYFQCMQNIDAKLLNEFKEKWLDELFLPIDVNPDEKAKTSDERFYSIGFTESGGLMLDASDFNVENINDAVKLFEKITGL